MTEMTTVADESLRCPLCGYDLRGLVEERCPECGFAFTWAELRDAGRDHHRYLFEHARPGRRVAAFWTTYFRTCRPRRFWREVTPANPVRRGPLVAYWVMTTVLLGGVVVGPLVVQGVQLGRSYAELRATVRPVPGMPGRFILPGLFVQSTAAEINALVPPVWSTSFVRNVADAYLQRTGGAFVAIAVVTAAWPWLTVLALLVFQASMRRAKTDVGHVVRAAVYGCDFGLLMTAATVAVYGLATDAPVGRPRGSEVVQVAAVLAVVTAACCVPLTTYRLTIAYARYLRFHLPLATVIASQVMAFLALLAVAVYAGQGW